MRAPSRRHGWITVVAALALTPGLVAAAPAAARDCPDQDLLLDNANAKQVRGAVRCLINEERRTRGRKPLTADSELRKAADKYAKQMVRDKFYSHVSPGGSTVMSQIKRTSYLGRGKYLLGENLGFGPDASGTPRGLVEAWMKSAVHRVHILDGHYRDIGVGVTRGTPKKAIPEGTTFAVEFGRRY